MSELFAPAAISVSELNALARSLLEDNLFGLWVAGEVSNLTRAASGHYYFSLKDSRAQVRCAMFKGTAAKLAAPLKEGDHIELTGKISIYEARGEFQITVNEVRLKGLGQLYEAYEKLKAQLQAEGVFAAERKKPLPAHPRTIGIVTSLAAAALRDVVSTLKRRAPEIPVIVYPTAVQGAGSEFQIAQAIQTASARAEADVLIVCRGGGSIEDLWAFNEEPVVRAIEACEIPVVSGVGHETDFTLADFVADVRAPTPTGAAELVSPNRLESLHKLAQAQGRLKTVLEQRYYDASQRVDWFARQIRHPQQKLNEQRNQLAALQQSLRFSMQNNHRFNVQKLARQQQTLAHLRPDISTSKRDVMRFQTALQQSRLSLFALYRQRLEKQAALLEAVSPQHILERGFSVVKNSRGQVIRSAHALKQGQKLHITFADGETDVRVTSEHKQPDLFDYS
ncbi:MULTISPECIES: exodeoxyribonuclease VII large subunit [unclassified Neisseria]|uniref:exodeoxyribonuclease VII large subunit n=1 Tax=unclassified Neisseria TaxID=2623750 RepID=UPI00266614C8|nr:MULTISPECIES: exodeoxyribonuclease VII large subunit [unclassified Neisseria]MDO1509108.1 exodeoxyribonuclease VII large subunit [Neisseria sp. MVDL19-042950]MDO1516797.1 exodeoxyribonuclease VII large subunit [Neisseria sp. MVDL18-041461]MDO1563991.1 exodeoxyribonuclease VII large subunit [Neisseria sp. MVDL20-010259]